MGNEIRGIKKLSKIGSSLMIIVNKSFLNCSGLKAGDMVEFTIKKVDDEGKQKQ